MMTYIANVDKDTFWAHATWEQFARLPDKEKVLVIVPVVGFADWGLGHPLDSEEIVSMAILREAVRGVGQDVLLKVLPPLRFVLGPYRNTFFGLDPETAYDFVEEVVHSVGISGFRRIVFYNSNPWNEEIIDKAVARDLRIKYGYQIFSINLYGLGLDFHPVRSSSRRRLQTLLTFLLDEEPLVDAPAFRNVPSDALELGEAEAGLALDSFDRVDVAADEGPEIVEETGRRLARLLAEIQARPPLANDGKIENRGCAPDGLAG